MDKKDFTIVGGGVIGTFHAYFLLQKGYSVNLLERNDTPINSSVMNFGQVVPSGMGGQWFNHGIKTMETYKYIQSKFNISLRQNGSIYIASTLEEMNILSEMEIFYNHKGYSCQILSKNEVLNQFPSIRSEYAFGGLFFPEECNVEPLKLIKSVQSFMTETYSNFQLITLNTVVSIEESSKEVSIKTSNGSIHISDQVIICAGYEYSILFPDLFRESGLLTCKLNMMSTQPFNSVDLKSNILTGLSIRRYTAFHQVEAYHRLPKDDVDQKLIDYGIHILFKQGFDGSIIIGDSHEYTTSDNPSKLTFRVDNDINDLILNEAKKIIELPNWDMKYYWAGYYSQHKSLDIFNYAISNRIRIVNGIGGKGMTCGCGYSFENVQLNY